MNNKSRKYKIIWACTGICFVCLLFIGFRKGVNKYGTIMHQEFGLLRFIEPAKLGTTGNRTSIS